MSEIENKIPFHLLTRCHSKYEPCTDEGHQAAATHYRNPELCKAFMNSMRHPANCMCHGSNQEPTQIGYEVLHLIKWAIKYAPWRLSDLRTDTLQQTIDYVSEEAQGIANKSKEIRGIST